MRERFGGESSSSPDPGYLQMARGIVDLAKSRGLEIGTEMSLSHIILKKTSEEALTAFIEDRVRHGFNAFLLTFLDQEDLEKGERVSQIVSSKHGFVEVAKEFSDKKRGKKASPIDGTGFIVLVKPKPKIFKVSF